MINRRILYGLLGAGCLVLLGGLWFTWPKSVAALTITDFSEYNELSVRAPRMPFRDGSAYLIVDGDLEGLCAITIYSGGRQVPQRIEVSGTDIHYVWGGPEYWIDRVRIVVASFNHDAVGKLSIRLHCGESPVPVPRSGNRGVRQVNHATMYKSEDLTGVDQLALAFLSAADVAVHEGLPHQRWERDLLIDELARGTSKERHGFHFYTETTALEASDREVIQSVIAEAASFEILDGVKLCGGFHPDYALAFSSAGDAYFVQLCFGCDELRAWGPNYSVYYDIEPDAADKLNSLFQKYRKDRPSKK